jgi:hypothetical protein
MRPAAVERAVATCYAAGAMARAAGMPVSPLGPAVSPAALNAVCRRFGVRRLDLFGSVARGEDDPTRSDLDILVTFEAMPPAAYADAYFGLKAALEEATGRPVDLLTEAALENPHLRRRVMAEARPLYPTP